jgi:GNAT acetyltransferase-like protein
MARMRPSCDGWSAICRNGKARRWPLLRADGGAIAAQVLMSCGPTAYAWKTAFDSAFAKYSQGALLAGKVTKELFAAPGIAAIDSCSAEGNFTVQLWAGPSHGRSAGRVGPGKSVHFTLEPWRPPVSADTSGCASFGTRFGSGPGYRSQRKSASRPRASANIIRVIFSDKVRRVTP